MTERLRVGIELNPYEDGSLDPDGWDVGPLVNYRVFDETERRPAMIVGTSSDRIGTPDGRAYYATLSKSLDHWTGLPIAPYVGTAFGEFEDEWELIGGLGIRWAERVTSTHLWDGENLHHLVDYAWDGGWRTGLVLAEQDGDYYAGLTLGLSFGSGGD
ncbi:hypothetical protein [Engelhardtia mirabilis]|uniref:Uncharacterized protein n=1 Tax=Engelhardtia mirabilis TaxID=2528011 RepID=A0A518BDW6_9BACT|nr:hypothetical protein Pla133_02410 [Planctomycetes bacterium Pla133]QDU99503.1 hypothetical protein Pla86_02410 [Planctomycetes bacterium Pla86]